jgi:predicted TIM-barrel fold metal-dependent hydrolase
VNKGVAHLTLIIFIIMVLMVGISYWFLGGNELIKTSPQEKQTCDQRSKQKRLKAEAYYEGPLIDTHIHMPTGSSIVSTIASKAGFPNMPVLGKDVTEDQIRCLFENEGISKAFGFYLMPKYQATGSYNKFKKSDLSQVIPFFMPPPVKQLNLSLESTKKIIKNSSGFFKGIGELPLYQESYGDISPDDEYFVGLYKIADDENLIIMIHVSDRQRSAAEKVVSQFPNVNFIFHGEDYVDWIVDMMDKYDNFYYSLDANIAELYSLADSEDEHRITVEQYTDYLDNNFEEILSRSLGLWQEAIEAQPDRFMWGTDRWFTWTYNPKVGAALEEFGRVFISRLDQKVQEGFAYKNAESLLKK